MSSIIYEEYLTDELRFNFFTSDISKKKNVDGQAKELDYP